MHNPTTLFTLCVLLTTGCSAKVDVTTESAASTSKTSVDVDLFQSTPDSIYQTERPGKQVVIGDNNSVIAAEHFHLHLHRLDSEARRDPESRKADCKRLGQQHLARVEQWREMFAKQ